MLRAEQFRQDTAKFWSDLAQKRKVLATEPRQTDKSPTCKGGRAARDPNRKKEVSTDSALSRMVP